jgi:hypothetical protein
VLKLKNNKKGESDSVLAIENGAKCKLWHINMFSRKPGSQHLITNLTSEDSADISGMIW